MTDPAGDAKQLSAGDELSGEGRETGVEDVTVRVTRAPWQPVVDLKFAQRFADMLRPHLPDFHETMRERLREALRDFEDLTRLELASFPRLIDFGEVLQPMLPDLSAIMPRIEFPEVSAGLRQLLQQLADKMPPNWPDGADFDLVFHVIQQDGIPLVWVPRADIVADVLAAADRDARIKVLLDRSADVVHDCRTVLNEVVHVDLLSQMPMAFSAVDAYAAGYSAPAQALAVAVVETVVTRAIGKYEQARAFAKIDNHEELTMAELRIRAALAPIRSFYVPWYPNSGAPMPESLSRHVTIHQADPTHYTVGNATVAIMLLASVLRGVQEMLDLVKPSQEVVVKFGLE